MGNSGNVSGGQGYAADDADPNEDVKFTTLLHKEGLWSLYGTKGVASKLYHICRDKKLNTTNSYVNRINYKCQNCSAEAPTEIKGLFQLHNFERIQEGQ